MPVEPLYAFGYHVEADHQLQVQNIFVQGLHQTEQILQIGVRHKSIIAFIMLGLMSLLSKGMVLQGWFSSINHFFFVIFHFLVF